MCGREDTKSVFTRTPNPVKKQKVFEVERIYCSDKTGFGVRPFPDLVFEVERILQWIEKNYPEIKRLRGRNMRRSIWRRGRDQVGPPPGNYLGYERETRRSYDNGRQVLDQHDLCHHLQRCDEVHDLYRKDEGVALLEFLERLIYNAPSDLSYSRR